MRRRGKIIIFSATAISILGLCLVLFFYHPAKFLEIDFLDVGQGDSELIKTPYGQRILIDGGPDNKVLAELGRNLPFLERKIDLVILTHPHDDHSAGLIDVLKKYRVDKILLTAAPSNAPPFEEFLRVARTKKVPLVIVASQEKISLGDNLDLDILHPRNSDSDVDLNDSSIVAKLVYKNKKFLFTGDAGVLTEEELMNSKIDLKVDVLKVGHHGSETASSLDFLRVVSPSIAIIEVGVDNKFGHPKADSLWRLNKVGAKILRTDLNGTIKIRSDGQKTEVKCKNIQN
jgi:competence protein ComEC